MADLTEVYAALQKADAAGDTEGAKQLADYIRTQGAAPAASVAAAPAAQPDAPLTFSDYLKNFGSAAVRPIVKAATALPGMAADTGVGLRNMAANLSNGITPTLADFNPFAKTGGTPQTYPLPSQSFNQALDTVTRAPSGLGKGAELVSTMLAGSKLPAPQAAEQAPANFQDATQAMRNQVVQRGQAAGYVVPPASNNPTFMNRLLEGMSGKLKLQQEAAARNQPVTDMLAARALGQNPEAPLTQEGLSAIRQEASQAGYAPLRQVGDIPTDPKFLSDLKGLTQQAEGASKSFPGIQPASPIHDVVTALSQPKFDSSDGLDAISLLRSQADDAFRSGNGTLGTQYKAASNAVENMIERHLSQQEGSEGLLDAFRSARQRMAQTYTAGKAIVADTGSSSAAKYAQALQAGKPLVGDQRTIGAFASQFRKASAFQTESVPSISPLDAYGSTIAAGASGSAAPLLLPLTRVGIREYLLSNAGQSRAIPQAFKAPDTLGAIGGLAALSNQVTSYLTQ